MGQDPGSFNANWQMGKARSTKHYRKRFNEELKKISGNNIDIIGVNNRNLDTLEIDLNNSIEMYKEIPDKFLKISESGISKVESILKLREVGYQGFLIGENFMKSDDPMEEAYNFIKEVENEI